jgi:ATP-dependent Clp protease protease subunit
MRNQTVALYSRSEPVEANTPDHTRTEEVLPLEDFAYRRLFQQRMVFLRGEIKDSVADDIAAQLLALDAVSDEDVTLFIDSPGGDITGLFAIHDSMQLVRARVHTRCVGMAASSAAVILATGTGVRSATPNARILIHQPHGGIQGTARDIEIHAKEFVLLRRRIDEILADRTGQPIERIQRDTDRDYWLTPEAARDYGLIDEIVGLRPKLVR